MRNGEIKPIRGAWSEESNAWVSQLMCLTGDCWLEVTMPDKGRMVIKKSETRYGSYKKALISPWTGPEFRIRMYGSTKYRFVRVYLTEEPTIIQLSSI